MTKQELALQYFPGAAPETAVRYLMRWIARCRRLTETLGSIPKACPCFDAESEYGYLER